MFTSIEQKKTTSDSAVWLLEACFHLLFNVMLQSTATDTRLKFFDTCKITRNVCRIWRHSNYLLSSYFAFLLHGAPSVLKFSNSQENLYSLYDFERHYYELCMFRIHALRNIYIDVINQHHILSVFL